MTFLGQGRRVSWWVVRSPSLHRAAKMATAVTVVVLTLISVSSRTMSTSARGPQPGYSDVNSRCQHLGHGGPCSAGVSSPPRGVALPNLYGHLTVLQAEAEVKVILNNMTTSVRGYVSSEFVRPFLCTLYLPPCLDSTHDEDATLRMRGLVLLPCRPLCEMAKEEVKRMANGLPSDGSRDRAGSWPSNIRCHMFPTERCFTLQGKVCNSAACCFSLKIQLDLDLCMTSCNNSKYEKWFYSFINKNYCLLLMFLNN